jgi:hypothetical protein
LLLSSSSAITLSHRTSSLISETFSSTYFIMRAPRLSSSVTSSLPSLKRLCHLKTLLLLIADSSETVLNIYNVSLGNFCCLRQHFIFTVCSIVHSIFTCGQSWWCTVI